MRQPTCVSVETKGRRLNVATWGHAGAPAVMLIHGLRDHCRSWDPVASALSERYRVIAPDLRGHGESDWSAAEGYSIAAYVADISDVADALHLSRCAVVGHSLGGTIGLRVTAAFPERVTAFVGIECVETPIQRDDLRSPRPFPARLREWLDRRRADDQLQTRYYPDRKTAHVRLRQRQPGIPDEIVRHLVDHGLRHDPGLGWRWKFDPAVRVRAPEDQHGAELDQVLEAVICPVLLCYGSASWIPTPSPERLGRLADCCISLYPGGGHWLHHQFSTRFVSETLAFLGGSLDQTGGR